MIFCILACWAIWQAIDECLAGAADVEKWPAEIDKLDEMIRNELN